MRPLRNTPAGAFLPVCLIIATGSLCGAAEIGFNERIRPILSENCFHCHGPDSASRKADLRLDTFEGATSGGAIVPGDAGESELIARIKATDPDDVMPPPDSHKKLKPGEKALIEQWIAQGAKWEEHWAFVSPERPGLPPHDRKWARNPIDAFVSAKLRSLNLEPGDEADRYTLARRAAFDLTGLPPAPAQVRRFVSDRKPGAYERYVEALLESPHYGEHRARFWLDAARYGDTHGLHLDNYREMWPWRDWVVSAYNENLPFDRFIVDQIAGDLVPNPTNRQRIATGFNRCNVSSSEGGSIPEELAVRYMIDRVETTSTVFLGLTAGCAVCHDHKFDPLSQKDFYRLAAFFNNVADPAMDGNQKDTPPVVVLPEGKMATEWNGVMKRRRELRAAMQARRAEIAETSPIGEHPVAADALRLWMPLDESGGDRLAVWIQGKRHEVERPENVVFAKNSPTGGGILFKGDGAVTIPDPGIFDPDAAFTISLWVKTPDIVRTSVLMEQLAAARETGDEEKKKPAKLVGYKLAQGVQGGPSFEWHGGAEGLIRANLPGEEALTPKKWQHLVVRYSGSRSETGLQFLVNGRRRPLRPGTEDHIDFEIAANAPLLLGKTFRTGGMSALRVFDRWLTDDEVGILASEPVLRKKNAPESLRRLHQAVAVDEKYLRLSRQFAGTQTRRDFIAHRSPTTMVMQERRDSEPMAHVLERGEYDRRGETVRPGVPEVLPAMAPGAPANRLGLAQWLTEPNHPLTARVAVNRLWQETFGAGIVLTSEDFGVMGERPTHPELLDWLAVEFVESGWDTKHVIRLMVTSAAYRQAALATPGKLASDPENRYLSRGPRRRLDAEALRDQALAVSGLLNRAIGGSPVKPPQPAGLWLVVAQGGSNTKNFVQDEGEDLYRRSVYTYWKRTAPPPPLAIFNAPSRESCTVRRERTNTPLQALVLLNETQFVESARVLAEKMIAAHPANEKARLGAMTFRVTGRPIDAADRATLSEAVAEFRETFSKSPDSAKSLIATGDTKPRAGIDPAELASWTMVASILLNRDDVINQN